MPNKEPNPWIEKMLGTVLAFMSQKFTGTLTLTISLKEGGIRNVKQNIENMIQ